jgi:hypothetical protein
MKVFTLFELQQFEAYPILKLANISDAEIQIFFNTPEAQRGSMIPNKVVRKVAPIAPKPQAPIFAPKPQRNTLTLVAPPKTIPMIVGTQLCTRSNIHTMALDLMAKDFEYNGKTYCLDDYGWRFRFGNTKRALGRCIHRTYAKQGVIELSQWVIDNSEETFDKWVNTMLHEIAHAIDVIIRGSSAHDWQWRSIALAIGCDGERTTELEFTDIVNNPISKYTLVCPNGHARPSHKRKPAHKRQSCSKCSSHFDERYIIKQIQNW